MHSNQEVKYSEPSFKFSAMKLKIEAELEQMSKNSAEKTLTRTSQIEKCINALAELRTSLGNLSLLDSGSQIPQISPADLQTQLKKLIQLEERFLTLFFTVHVADEILPLLAMNPQTNLYFFNILFYADPAHPSTPFTDLKAQIPLIKPEALKKIKEALTENINLISDTNFKLRTLLDALLHTSLLGTFFYTPRGNKIPSISSKNTTINKLAAMLDQLLYDNQKNKIKLDNATLKKLTDEIRLNFLSSDNLTLIKELKANSNQFSELSHFIEEETERASITFPRLSQPPVESNNEEKEPSNPEKTKNEIEIPASLIFPSLQFARHFDAAKAAKDSYLSLFGKGKIEDFIDQCGYALQYANTDVEKFQSNLLIAEAYSIHFPMLPAIEHLISARELFNKLKFNNEDELNRVEYLFLTEFFAKRKLAEFDDEKEQANLIKILTTTNIKDFTLTIKTNPIGTIKEKLVNIIKSLTDNDLKMRALWKGLLHSYLLGGIFRTSSSLTGQALNFFNLNPKPPSIHSNTSNLKELAEELNKELEKQPNTQLDQEIKEKLLADGELLKELKDKRTSTNFPFLYNFLVTHKVLQSKQQEAKQEQPSTSSSSMYNNPYVLSNNMGVTPQNENPTTLNNNPNSSLVHFHNNL